MSEETVPSILTNDTSSVDLSLPLLPKGEYVLAISEVKLGDSNKGKNDLVRIKLKTTEPTLDATGQETLRPGHPVYDQISLTPTDKYPQENIVRRLTAFQRAAGFMTGAFFPVERFVGQTVKAVVDIQPAQGQYDEKNNIARYLVPKATK